jgi:hypothetical protein
MPVSRLNSVGVSECQDTGQKQQNIDEHDGLANTVDQPWATHARCAFSVSPIMSS